MMKICNCCGIEKDLSEFNKHSRQKDGLDRKCRTCANEYLAVYRDKHRIKMNESYKKWFDANPGVAANNARKSRALDPDRHNEYSAKYRKLHPNRRKTSCKKYRDENADRERVYRKIYASKNKDKLAAKSSFRRAVKLMATPLWANAGAIKDFYSLSMRVSEQFKIQHHVDHIVPLVSDIVCGLHCEFNLRVIPGIENMSKSNKHWPNMP